MISLFLWDSSRCWYMPLSWLWLLAALWMSDIQSVLSPAALLSSCRLKPVASFGESIHLMSGLPLFLLPAIFFQLYYLFWRTPLLMMCPSRTAPVLSFFLRPVMFQAYFALGPIRSSFWQSRRSAELSSNNILQMNPFFFYQLFSLSNFCICR